VLVLCLLALSGIVARPTFPFDPGRFRVGAGQIIAVALLGAVAFATYYEMRRWPLGSEIPAEVARPALGAVSAVGVLLAWLANPYLALLLVPLAHVWLVGSRRGERLRWPLIAAAVALALLPLVAAIAQVSDRLNLGITAPWQLALMVGDGQIGFVPVVALCLLAGCMAGLLAVVLRSRTPVPAPGSAPTGRPMMSLDAERHPVGSVVRRDVDASPIRGRPPADDLGGDR
jgi:hypothetical protein